MATFHRGFVEDNRFSLYSAFQYVNVSLNTITKERLLELLADRILLCKRLHPIVEKHKSSGESIQKYCNRIKKGKLPSGELALQALSILAGIIIRLVSIKEDDQGNVDALQKTYNDGYESTKDCVYMLYDEIKTQYYPLYFVDEENPTEKKTIFDRNDPKMLQFFEKYVKELKEQPNHNAALQPDESPTSSKEINEDEHLSGMITTSASEIRVIKRKEPEYADLLLAEKVRKHSKTETAPLKHNQDQSDLMEQSDCSTSESQSTDDAALTSDQTAKMKLQVEPPRKFRGRTKGDFTPSKSNPSKQKPPRCISDRNNNHFLNLLIPKSYLLTDLCSTLLEISVITRKVNGFSYINSYFNLPKNYSDPYSQRGNPIYIPLDNAANLSSYSEIFHQLKLRLMLVVCKNEELMECDQPLKVFSAPQNASNKKPITDIFETTDEFKKAYHLADMRLAFTLKTKNPDNGTIEPDSSKQYISQISTENRKHKKSTSKKKVIKFKK
ncbi:hypothetical protein I4U23_013917 [Adineta vaga]|nr:hypothetical protein I4U23_013917 [Adineta vaga]